MIETRRAAVLADIAYLRDEHRWPGLIAAGKITASREIAGRSTTATRYDLMSKALSAERFSAVVRAHWTVDDKGSARVKIKRAGWTASKPRQRLNAIALNVTPSAVDSLGGGTLNIITNIRIKNLEPSGCSRGGRRT